jgi:hypothetical protein
MKANDKILSQILNVLEKNNNMENLYVIYPLVYPLVKRSKSVQLNHKYVRFVLQ